MRNTNTLFLLISIVVIVSFASGTQISGTTYDWIEETPLEFTIIKAYFEENLAGQAVSDKNGFYSLSLAEGQYFINAQYTKNGSKYSTDENITVLGNEIVLDLLLIDDFPEITNIEDLPQNIFPDEYFAESSELEEEPVVIEQEPQEDNSTLCATLAGIVLLSAIFLIFAKHSHFKKPKSIELSDNTVLSIIQGKKECLQSDIVEKTGFSEAKVSLIIKSLIEQGKIQKQKVGRNNVLSLKKQ